MVVGTTQKTIKYGRAPVSDQQSNSSEKRECLCEVCQLEYPVWFAPNELWNAVMRWPNGREISEKIGFICPTCFAKEAKEKGVKTTGFMLATDEYIQANYLPRKQVEADKALLTADLAWCLGKLRGLNNPAEHLEKKHELGLDKKKGQL